MHPWVLTNPFHMRIAVNTRMLIADRLDGTGWFSAESLKRIVAAHPEHQFIFLFDRPYDNRFVFAPNVTPLVVFPPARHPLLWYAWFEISLPPILKKWRPDLFFSPDGFLSLRAGVPSFIVIHDLNFEHHPEWLPPASRWFYRHFFPWYAKKASMIATVSEFTRNDICHTYGIPTSKIDVTPVGVDTDFHPLDEAEKRMVKQELTGGDDYFLFSGNQHPRKNISRMLAAFERFREKTDLPVKMVITGKKLFLATDVKQTLKHMRCRHEVIFTGWLDRPQLGRITASALAAVYVSLFEGFGIPLLEAMQCEVPLLTSRITAMPEVASGAALYADPLSIDSITDGMIQLATNEEIRKRLLTTGRERREQFSWNCTADKLWKMMERCMQQEKFTA